MIPKLLHFIWYGHRPEYVDFCIRSFKEINPSFRINFVYIDSFDRYQNLLEEIDDNTGKYQKTIISSKSRGLNTKQILSDILRLELLNQYGGIYLDCDCFPIRPFDDYILSSDFVVTRLYQKDFIRRDCFFIGKSMETEDITYYNDFNARNILLNNRVDRNDIDFIKRKKLFQECLLERKITNCKEYIEHFNMEKWRE